MIDMFRSPIVTGVMLGAMFLYCAYGAVAGDLVFFARNGPTVHLHGLAAWLVTLSPVLVSASLSIRGGGLLEFSSDNTRRATYLGLMIGGVALFLLVLGLNSVHQ
jgi:hypothetical protein